MRLLTRNSMMIQRIIDLLMNNLLSLLSFLLIIWTSVLISKNEKIDIKKIVKSHFSTFGEKIPDDSNLYSKKIAQKSFNNDNCTFLVVPYLFCLLSLFSKDTVFTQGILEILLIVISVLFGFLMSSFATFSSVKIESNNDLSRIEEVYFNVSYSILLSIVISMVLLLMIIIYPHIDYKFIKIIGAFLIFLYLHMMLTLFMVLKRIVILNTIKMKNWVNKMYFIREESKFNL